MSFTTLPQKHLESFTDPLSLEPLQDPWLHIGCSKDFNYSSVIQIIEKYKKCPWCRAEVQMRDFIPNRTLKSGLEEMQSFAVQSFELFTPSAPSMDGDMRKPTENKDVGILTTPTKISTYSSNDISLANSANALPLSSPRATQRTDSAERKKAEPQKDTRIVILDEASIFPRETMATSSMKPRGQYMPREEGRLTLAYRDLLPQINGPLAVVEADYQGAYDKLHRFQADSARVELESLSQEELVAIRNAHNRVMEIPDYKRHRDLKDDRFFDAIVDQLRLKH